MSAIEVSAPGVSKTDWSPSGGSARLADESIGTEAGGATELVLNGFTNGVTRASGCGAGTIGFAIVAGL